MTPVLHDKKARRETGGPSQCENLAAGRQAEGADVEAPIIALEALTTAALRIEWRRLYRATPPTRLSRDLVIRGVAHMVQEHVTAHSARGMFPGALEKELGLAVIARKEERARAYRIAGGGEVPA